MNNTHQVDIFPHYFPLPCSPVLDAVILREFPDERRQFAVLIPRDGGEEVVLQLILHTSPDISGKTRSKEERKNIEKIDCMYIWMEGWMGGWMTERVKNEKHEGK